MKKTPKIDQDQPNPARKYYSFHSDGYGFQNGDFIFSDKIIDWMQAKVRRSKHYKDLF